MANDTSLEKVDEIRAAILAQVIRRDYLEHMLKDARVLELAHGSDYSRTISSALEDLKKKEIER